MVVVLLLNGEDFSEMLTVGGRLALQLGQEVLLRLLPHVRNLALFLSRRKRGGEGRAEYGDEEKMEMGNPRNKRELTSLVKIKNMNAPKREKAGEYVYPFVISS